MLMVSNIDVFNSQSIQVLLNPRQVTLSNATKENQKIKQENYIIGHTNDSQAGKLN